jgi:hypothetical protein
VNGPARQPQNLAFKVAENREIVFRDCAGHG